MYSMTADATLQGRLDHTMFLPDSLDGVQEGAVLEETMLARDEMANLAWAIEHTVQGVSGEPLDRDLEAKALAFQQRIAFDGGVDSPQLVYRLQTPVPANWTPLLPVRDTPLNLADPLTIRLARAGMKRFYPEASVDVIGAVDPGYIDFLALLDAQDNFVTRVAIGDGLRAYVFYPRGWMLRRDPLQPMPDDDTLRHRGGGSAAHRRDAQAQVPICAQQRRSELAVDRSQQDGGTRRGAKRVAI